MSPAPRRSPRTLSARTLTTALRRQLGEGDPVVLWEQNGSRVLVHAAELKATIHDAGIVVTVPLESDETGRGDVQVALALARGGDAYDTFAVAPPRPVGDPVLAARWGETVQNAVYAALLQVADARAGGPSRGVRVRGGALEVGTPRTG